MKSPFKFLDAYTLEDRDIFFGREQETEEMYRKVFESRILLVYGISGTGKTSLINCGLANKFEESDWLPVFVRRGRNLPESLGSEIRKCSLTPLQSPGKKPAPGQIVKSLQSLYLDHFIPVYLVFDQFEELFIFGDREERRQFMQIVKAVADSDVQCRMIFSIREEYLAGVTEFEELLPDFMGNRMRVEKMTRQHAVEVIEGPCKVHGIEVEEGFSEALLNKLNPESNEVELTYLQVFLDKIFRLATKSDTTRIVVNDIPRSGINDDSLLGGSSDSGHTAPSSISFTLPLLEQIGDVSDLLGSFLEEQISALDDPDSGLAMLKSLVSLKGTRKQILEKEIQEATKTFGQDIPDETLKTYLQQFVNLRILKDKDETGRYELRHDSLADKIYEKITLVEKELLEVRQFLENALDQYEKRKIYLTTEDLKYIAPFEDKLFLNKRTEKYIEASKEILSRTIRRRRQILGVVVLAAFIVLSVFTVWAVVERTKATRALKEKEIAEEKLNEAAKDFVMFPRNLNILYKGIENPVSFAIPGAVGTTIKFGSDFPLSLDLHGRNMILIPRSTGIATISLYRVTENDTTKLGSREFDVRNLPDPIATLNGKKSGYILREELNGDLKIQAIIKDFNYNYEFDVLSYEISFDINKGKYVSTVNNNEIPEYVSSQFPRINHNSNLVFRNIRVIGPDEVVRNLGTLSLTVVRWFNYESPKVFYSLVEQAGEDEDWDNLIKLGTENLIKYYWDNPDMLNDVAYQFYFSFLSDSLSMVSEEHPAFKNIQKAQEWSRRAVELGKNNPDYLHTNAVLLFRLGRLDEAEMTMIKVIELLKARGEQTGDAEIFLQRIKKTRYNISELK